MYTNALGYFMFKMTNLFLKKLKSRRLHNF